MSLSCTSHKAANPTQMNAVSILCASKVLRTYVVINKITYTYITIHTIPLEGSMTIPYNREIIGKYNASRSTPSETYPLKAPCWRSRQTRQPDVAIGQTQSRTIDLWTIFKLLGGFSPTHLKNMLFKLGIFQR